MKVFVLDGETGGAAVYKGTGCMWPTDVFHLAYELVAYFEKLGDFTCNSGSLASSGKSGRSSHMTLAFPHGHRWL